MKNLLMSAVMAVGLFAATSATAESHPGACYLKFAVHIDSVVLFSHGYGNGLVICSNAHGATVKSKVKIAIDGIGLGLGTFDLRGVSESVGILRPGQLDGVYLVAQANVGAGPAVGANLGFEGQDNGLAFGGSIDAGTGIGVYLNGTRWVISH